MAEGPDAMSNANPERWCWLEPGDARVTLHLRGAWRLPRLHEIEVALRRIALPRKQLQLERSALDTIDTASALARRLNVQASTRAPSPSMASARATRDSSN